MARRRTCKSLLQVVTPTAVILRSPRSGRPEGWKQATCLLHIIYSRFGSNDLMPRRQRPP